MPAEDGPAVAPAPLFLGSLGRRNDAINILGAGGKSRPFVNRFVTIAQ
jgi:hypothetical protein